MSTATPLPEYEKGSTQPANTLQAQRIFIANLPLSGEEVFGREAELQILDTAWNEEYPHIIELIAPGGMGKTALVGHWLKQMQTDSYCGAERILGWSFPGPGEAEASADEFLTYALKVCDDPEPAKGPSWSKGKRLAHTLRAQRMLLVLENIDALQYLDGDMRGRLKDPGIKALLYALYRFNPGLCILTTSLPIQGLDQHAAAKVKQITLPALSPEAGAQLLRAYGVNGSTGAIKKVVNDFDGHPLALTLLGGYLVFIHRGDIRKIDINSPLTRVGSADRHVRRVIDAFTIWLQRKPELNMLFLMGLFDLLLEADTINAPDHDGILEALLASPLITGVTDYIHDCAADQWQAAIARLQELRLLTEKTVFFDTLDDVVHENSANPEKRRAFDCHPLVREYFAKQLRKRLPNSWREAQSRLYDSYTRWIENDFPETLEEMQPLFAAVRHGCQAGQYEEVFDEIYWPRIHRSADDYCTKTLNAPGADLAALAHFFIPHWKHPVQHLSDEMQARLLDIAAAKLEKLGRLREAAELIKEGMVFWNTQEDWEKAAQHASVLSQLLLPSGEVEQAVIHARLALQLSEQGEDNATGESMRVRLLRTLHVAGDLQEAEQVCREAEAIQQDPDSLMTMPPCADFICCDLLLHLGKYQDVQERVARKTEGHTQGHSPLDLAAGKFLSGKALLFQAISMSEGDRHLSTGLYIQAKNLLDQAIEAFRDIGALEWLIQGLLTRAAVSRVSQDFSGTASDLEDVRELTDLGGMPLYRTDYYLESARLVYEQFAADQGKFSGNTTGEELHQHMHDHVEVAEALIWRTGYHLRDAEFESLMTLLKDTVPERVEEAEITEYQQEIIIPPAKQHPAITQPAKPDQEIKWIERQEQKIRRAGEYDNVYLYPGELYIAEHPTVVWTLLGSCIAVTLYAERLKLGSICHAQLPQERFRDGPDRTPCMHPCYKGDAPDPEQFKYVTCSIRYMYEQFAARGIMNSEMTVKLFGGASVLEGVPDTMNIGDENVRIARQVLREYSLKVVRKDIGGKRGRTLYFYSDTGEVFMRKHRSSEQQNSCPTLFPQLQPMATKI